MEQVFIWILTLFSLFTNAPLDVIESPVVTVVETEVARVIDGDTIDVLIDGVEQRVRYIGIDTPEPYREGAPECFSTEASAYNTSLVEGKLVRLKADVEDKDRYGRLLRYVYVDDVFVNEKLIQEGYATTLPIKPNTTYAQSFKRSENDAKSDARGLWGACQ